MPPRLATPEVAASAADLPMTWPEFEAALGNRYRPSFQAPNGNGAEAPQQPTDGRQVAALVGFLNRVDQYKDVSSFDLIDQAVRLRTSDADVADIGFRLPGLKLAQQSADEEAPEFALGIRGGLYRIADVQRGSVIMPVVLDRVTPGAFTEAALADALQGVFGRAIVPRSAANVVASTSAAAIGGPKGGIRDVSRHPQPAALPEGDAPVAPTPPAPEKRWSFRPRRAALAAAGLVITLAGAFARANAPAEDAPVTPSTLRSAPVSATAQPSRADVDHAADAAFTQMDHHQGLRQPTTAVDRLPAYNAARQEGTVDWLVRAEADARGVHLTPQQEHVLVIDTLRASLPDGRTASVQHLLREANTLHPGASITINLGLLASFGRQNHASR